MNNNCATGSSALFLAKQLVAGGLSDCVLALGFEKMQKGSLSSVFFDRAAPVQPMVEAFMMQVHRDLEAAPIAPQLFGNAGREHMDKYGTKAEALRKNRAQEPQAFGEQSLQSVRDEYIASEQINGAPMVHEPF